LEGDEWIGVGQHKKGFSATIVSIGIEESSPRVQELDIVLNTTNVEDDGCGELQLNSNSVTL